MGADESIIIVAPLYNDWNCLYRLLSEVKNSVSSEIYQNIEYVIVDDCSTQKADTLKLAEYKIEIVSLVTNLGHQKAIAIGLAYVAKERKAAKVVVMDVDGEDRPQDIMELIRESNRSSKRIIFAHRQKRTEGLTFRIFYRIYQVLFRTLTGKSISFGNFCLIPFSQLVQLVYVSEIWNHFSGAIVRSKIPFIKIPIERGSRFSGDSKMNFISLVIHGMSAVSVYIDVIAVRLIIFTIIMILLCVIGIIIVMVIRLFTGLGVPGWATFSILGLIIILFLAFFLGIFVTFMVLANRMRRNFIPAIEYVHYISHKRHYE